MLSAQEEPQEQVGYEDRHNAGMANGKATDVTHNVVRERVGFEDHIDAGMADKEVSSSEPTMMTPPGGMVEIEPGVAGAAPAPHKLTSEPIPTTPTPQQQVTSVESEAEVNTSNQTMSQTPGTIQLVPKKPSLWTRIKFLFTGHL